MAREYQSAASLIPKELSSDLGSGGADHLGPIGRATIRESRHAPAVKREAEEDWR